MIKRNKKGQFDKGNDSGQRFTRERSLGNQSAKGNPPNKTSFKVGEHAMEKHPLWKGGLHKMKKGCMYINLGGGKRIRRPLFVWESVYGEIPKGYVLFHKDGDFHNDDIENLEVISRAELLQRNRKN